MRKTLRSLTQKICLAALKSLNRSDGPRIDTDGTDMEGTEQKTSNISTVTQIESIFVLLRYLLLDGILTVNELS